MVHQLMEQCLDEILELERWDRAKLEVPVVTGQLKGGEEV